MTRLISAHTAELTVEELAAVRSLMDTAFDDLSDQDWDHSLGGTHALVVDDGVAIAHGALVSRRLLHLDRSWRAGYVEALATRPDRRRQGHASTVLTALETLAPAYDLLALSSSGAGVALYETRGWRRWEGPTSVLSPRGIEPTPDDDGSVYVLPGDSGLDLAAALTCDWRDGDVW